MVRHLHCHVYCTNSEREVGAVRSNGVKHFARLFFGRPATFSCQNQNEFDAHSTFQAGRQQVCTCAYASQQVLRNAFLPLATHIFAVRTTEESASMAPGVPATRAAVSLHHHPCILLCYYLMSLEHFHTCNGWPLLATYSKAVTASTTCSNSRSDKIICLMRTAPAALSQLHKQFTCMSTGPATLSLPLQAPCP